MIIFVADAFVENYVGGAELTTEAIIKKCLLPHKKLLSSQVSIGLMEDYKESFWIFGNFQNLSDACKLHAIKNLNYSVIEYDYKFCQYRLPQKHIAFDGECRCSHSAYGKLQALFISNSKINWWMSRKQKQAHQEQFTFMRGEVLSSVFTDDNLSYIESLDTSSKEDVWIILNSQSWVKGVKKSVQYAKDNNLKYELVWGLEYREFLQKLANSRGLIFLPEGADTCPRMVIEAKLLDCELIINDNVQHKVEPWFETKESCLEYLRGRASFFWEHVEGFVEFLPSLAPKASPQLYHIVVPFYNAFKYLPKCIDSIKRQRHTNFTCTLIDDMSTDESWLLASNLIGEDPRFTLVKNKVKSYALKNIADSIQALGKADEIIILLDGDDWFSSSLSLTHLDRVYQDENCWLTYGSYVMYPHGHRGIEPSEYPTEVIEQNLYRSDKWRASHLRTFRRSLWDHLNIEDLKDKGGNFYKMAYDQAIMLPLLELCGDRHKYVVDILHVYNKENPLNVDKIKTQQQLNTANQIRRLRPYERLS